MSKKYTVVELKKICKSKGIKGYSKMKKAELMKHCLKSKSPAKSPPKKISKKKIVKKPKTYSDVLMMYMIPNQQYSFDDIMDLMREYYIPPKSKYVFDIDNKSSYVIAAMKKIIKKGQMIQHLTPGVRTKYVGHYYEIKSKSPQKKKTPKRKRRVLPSFVRKRKSPR